jgi:hypothetical protein
MSLQRIIRKSSEAARGVGTAGKAFKALGIDVKDSNGNLKDSESIMSETLYALGKVREDGVRNDLASAIFDSEGVALVQLAKIGEKAIKGLRKEGSELGGFLSEEDVQNSETFADKILNLSEAFAGLGNKIAKVLLPVLNPLLEKLKNLLIEIGPDISIWAKKFAEKLPARLEILQAGFKDLAENLKPVMKVAKWISENFGLMNTAFALVGTLIVGSLIGAIYSMVTAVLALGAAFGLTPVGWIIGGIAAIVAVGITLYKNWDKITSVWNGLVERFKADPFKLVGDSVKKLHELNMKYNPFIVIARSANSLIERLTGINIFKGIKDALSSFITFLATNNPFTLMSNSVDSLLKAFEGFDVLNKIQTKLQGLLPNWAIDMLGLDSTEAVMKAPLINNKSSKTEISVKIEEGKAIVQGVKTTDSNASIQVDTGKANPSPTQFTGRPSLR